MALARAGLGARIGAAAVVLAAIAVAVALAPALREVLARATTVATRERAEHRAELVRRLEAEQRPRTGRSGAARPPAPPAAPAALDGRGGCSDHRRRPRPGAPRRALGPIRRVDCEAFPRSLDARRRRRGPRPPPRPLLMPRGHGRVHAEAAIGHQYRALVDFESGRYTYCKVTGQSGPTREQLVTTPRACGG